MTAPTSQAFPDFYVYHERSDRLQVFHSREEAKAHARRETISTGYNHLVLHTVAVYTAGERPVTVQIRVQDNTWACISDA